jgi:DNA mismatch repair protein MutS2
LDRFTLEKVEYPAVLQVLSRFCMSGPGRALAVRLRPSNRLEIVRRWLEQTREMVRAVREAGLPPCGSLRDVRQSLRRAVPGGGADGEDFAAIASTLSTAKLVREFLDGLPDDLPALHQMAERIEDFQPQVDAIRSVVADDGEILDDASPRLRSIRRQVEDLTARIREVIYGYLRRPDVSRLLQQAQVTIHGDRFVLPVKAENRGRLPGVVHRASNTGATLFVEPEASVELNNQIAELYNQERLEIQRLLDELAMKIQPRCEDMLATCRAAAHIDVLAAKAQYSYQFEMACPEVAVGGPLELNDARHPLLLDQQFRDERDGVAEQDRHRVVPVSLRLGEDFDVLVVTGSNTGGKTVALKTAALLALMAQSGLHVPARRGAKLPVFDDVYIDIGDEQSLEQSLSTFGGHIRRLRHILRRSTKRSLVLLDELGAGTDPDEGGAIGQAVLDELLRRGCLAMVTTHLGVLKAYAFGHERADNASVEFDTENLEPTYRLHIGTPGESHAITVAERLGMPPEIMSAARNHLSGQGRQFMKAIRRTNRARRDAETARRQAVDAREAAQNQQDQYADRLADLQQLREEFETWLVQLGEWKPGQEVPLPSLNRSGRLVRLELHRQVAVVDLENVQMEIPLRELMPDFGQKAAREQIQALRRQLAEKTRQAEADRTEARRQRQKLREMTERMREQGRQFDRWLGRLARARIGQTVPISRPPGRGELLELDLPALKARVKTQAGELDLSVQELFPQSGPHAEAADKTPQTPGEDELREAGKDRKLRRRSPESAAARRSREAVKHLRPGEMVYVVPFRKRAKLLRIDEEKQLGVVLSGAFEMEVPLGEIEPDRREGG